MASEAEMPRYGDEDYDHDAICAALSNQKMQWTSAGRIAQAVPLIRVDPDFRLMLSLGTPDSVAEGFEVTVYGAVIEPDEDACYPLAAVYVNGFGTMLDVDIKDVMTDNNMTKEQLHIANTGNVDEYVRMLIMGNWYGWKPGTTAADTVGVAPSILVGYKYKDAAAAAADGICD